LFFHRERITGVKMPKTTVHKDKKNSWGKNIKTQKAKTFFAVFLFLTSRDLWDTIERKVK